MGKSLGTEHWPAEIRNLAADKRLEVDCDHGVTFASPAELRRVESPSAEGQGLGPADKKIVAERKHVGILEVEPVGNYAVKIKFDDLHDTGIFSWQYLYQLGENQDEIWQAYLSAMQAKGLSLEPERRA